MSTKGFKIYRVVTRCLCGKEVIVYEGKLRYGSTRSCGCLQTDRARDSLPKPTHGKARHSMGGRSPAYLSWQAMHDRCRRPGNVSYDKYGGRGIMVCEHWNKFENFLADMGERAKGLTLDRIDPNGNYEPGNCRWANWFIQEGNRTNNVMVTLNNERMHLSKAGRSLGFSYNSITRRAKYHKKTVQEIIDQLALRAQ